MTRHTSTGVRITPNNDMLPFLRQRRYNSTTMAAISSTATTITATTTMPEHTMTQTFANIVKHTMAGMMEEVVAERAEVNDGYTGGGGGDRTDIDVTQTSDYPYSTLVKVLAPITVVGWLVAGVVCAAWINSRGRAGRWVPEWYLDSRGTKMDVLLLATWWAIVVVGWPVGVVFTFIRWVCQLVGKRARRSKRSRNEKGGRCGRGRGVTVDEEAKGAPGTTTGVYERDAEERGVDAASVEAVLGALPGRGRR